MSDNEQRDELARDIFIADNGRDPNAAEEWDAFSDIGGVCGGDYAQNIADGLIAKGHSQPRTITTVEELDALPVGSVVLRNGRAFQRFAPRSAGLYEYRMWQCTDGGFVRSTKDGSSILPATVLHEPETEAAEVGIDECNGSGRCEVSKHVHGCYSDLGRCDEPTEHEGTR